MLRLMFSLQQSVHSVAPHVLTTVVSPLCCISEQQPYLYCRTSGMAHTCTHVRAMPLTLQSSEVCACCVCFLSEYLRRSRSAVSYAVFIFSILQVYIYESTHSRNAIVFLHIFFTFALWKFIYIMRVGTCDSLQFTYMQYTNLVK